MALMRARHDVFGVCDVPDNDYYREIGWTEVDTSTPTNLEAERQAEADAYMGVTAFDPAAHSVDDVNTYLETADAAERTRVLDAEREGKARKSLLGE